MWCVCLVARKVPELLDFLPDLLQLLVNVSTTLRFLFLLESGAGERALPLDLEHVRLVPVAPHFLLPIFLLLFPEPFLLLLLLERPHPFRSLLGAGQNLHPLTVPAELKFKRNFGDV